jgi:hypothetical protein
LFVCVNFVVGLRLLLLARRTHEVVELAIGAATFAGGIGYFFYVVAIATPLASGALRFPAFVAAISFLDLGVVFHLLGVWRVFRPGRRWAVAVFASGAAALAVHWVVAIVHYDPSGARGTLAFWLFNGIAAAGYAWSAVECLRYHAILRKRARIGLAEPEMVHRVLLWGCAGGAALLLMGLAMLNRSLHETGIDPRIMLGQSLLGIFGSFSIWLAFFPPAAYLRMVVGAEARS